PSVYSYMLMRPPTSSLFPTRRSSDIRVAFSALRSGDVTNSSQNFRGRFLADEPGGVRLRRAPISAVGRSGQKLGLDGVSPHPVQDRKSTRLNSSHVAISYAVSCLKKK